MTTPQTAQEPAGNLALFVNLRNQIRQVLATTPSLSTGELAKVVNTDRNRVYRQCLRLEKEGLLLRSLGVRHRLFCIDCRQVVTNATHDTCKDHNIRAFPDGVCEWEVMPQRLQTPQPKSVN